MTAREPYLLRPRVMAAALTLGLSATALAAEWSAELTLRDHMRLYSFPEELVSYGLKFPPKSVRAGALGLVALHGGEPKPVAFQLSGVVEKGGFLEEAVLSFRTDLPKGGERRFRLTSGLGAATAGPRTRVGIVEEGDRDAVLAGNLLRVRVPRGRAKFQGGKLLGEVPAPILAIARGPGPGGWVGRGSFVAPSALKVLRLDAECVTAGPLFAEYRVAYALEGGKRYTVVLTVRHDETYVTVDEHLERFEPNNGAYLRFDFTPGLDPNRRQVMSNGGYNRPVWNPYAGGRNIHYCGAYDADLRPGGKLPLELGIYKPNSLGIMRSAALWSDKGPHALLLALYRLRDWRTARRLVWHATEGPGNLNFYSRGHEKYMTTRLEGRERHWAMALIPRQKMVYTRITPGNCGRQTTGAGPEVRLWQKLAGFSLDKIKDWVFEWDEATERRLPAIGKEVSYERWLRSNGLEAPFWFLNAIVNYYWDFSAEAGPVSFRLMPSWFGDYARSRAHWTTEQRQHVRAILLWMAHSCDDDNNVPHHSMLGGHPNFIMDVKQTLPLACATFPNHPDAKRWRDSFLRYYEEWLATYQRDPDPEHCALGGRWTENIACYSGTSLRSVLHSHKALAAFDGTNLLDHPRLRAWVRWYLNAMMSPHKAVRLVPPEGAHAAAFLPTDRHGYRDDLLEIARQIADTAPKLSRQMRWVQTNGAEGERPPLKSVLVRDYGPVLRHDFGGPREAYLHMTQIAGRWNYRWGRGADVLYYGAKNRAWSYNTPEAAGDRFDLNNVSSFSVDGKGLGRHRTDQPLYDFGFAQYYRAVCDPKYNPHYHARGMMLLRDDYIVLHDDVAGDAEGQFVWATIHDLPRIYQLRPAANPEEATHREGGRGRAASHVAKIRRYRGRGDFLTLVAPEPLAVRATTYGAVVGADEHVLCSDRPMKHQKGNLRFEGKVGYARPGQVALFEGERLVLNGLGVGRDGGDFGLSAALAGRRIVGRFAGRVGGRATITLPKGLEASRATVTLDGKRVEAIVEARSIRFKVHVTLRDGRRSFEITF